MPSQFNPFHNYAPEIVNEKMNSIYTLALLGKLIDDKFNKKK